MLWLDRALLTRRLTAWCRDQTCLALVAHSQFAHCLFNLRSSQPQWNHISFSIQFSFKPVLLSPLTAIQCLPIAFLICCHPSICCFLSLKLSGTIICFPFRPELFLAFFYYPHIKGRWNKSEILKKGQKWFSWKEAVKFYFFSIPKS